jgi:HAD superfamily hydrolase (TIGR01509 family)
MPLELVIFDCDGVLVDSEPITTRTIVEAVGEAGLAWTCEDVRRRFHGGRLAHVLAAAEGDLGRPLAEDFVERFRARLYERLRAEVRPVPGVRAALEALPWPCCVASNGPRAKMEATLGSTGLLARFEGRVFSAYEVGSFKPDPGLFLHAAATLGAEPGACAVVEDSSGGLRAARAAGMRAVAYVGHGLPTDTTDALVLQDMRRLPELLAALPP